MVGTGWEESQKRNLRDIPGNVAEIGEDRVVRDAVSESNE
mgnify:CR=1 FL=1